jgi:hypothetical protein
MHEVRGQIELGAVPMVYGRGRPGLLRTTIAPVSRRAGGSSR